MKRMRKYIFATAYFVWAFMFIGVSMAASDSIKIEIKAKRSRAFIDAVKNNRIDEAKKLLFISHRTINARDKQDRGAIFYAVKNNNIEFVKYLVRLGACVDKKDVLNESNETAVFINSCIKFLECVKAGDFKTAESMLEKDRTIVNVRDNDGQGILFYAYKNNEQKIFKVLTQKYGAFVYKGLCKGIDRTKWSDFHKEVDALRRAIKSNSVNAFKLFYKDEALKKIHFEIGMTPLLLAAANGSSKIFKYLVKTDKIDITQQDARGRTSFEYAICKDEDKILKYFVKMRTSDIIQKNRYGMTALELAASKSCSGTFKYFADLFKMTYASDDKQALEVLKFAFENNNEYVYAHFVKCGFPFNTFRELAKNFPAALKYSETLSSFAQKIKNGCNDVDYIENFIRTHYEIFVARFADEKNILLLAAEAGNLAALRVFMRYNFGFIEQFDDRIDEKWNVLVKDYLTDAVNMFNMLKNKPAGPITQEFIKNNMDLVNVFVDNKTFLTTTIEKDDLEQLRKLINYGVRIRRKMAKKAPNNSSVKKYLEAINQALFYKVKLKFGSKKIRVINFEQLELLIRTYPEIVNLRFSHHGSTILHHVAVAGDLERLKFLVEECKVDVNARDFDGMTPLHLVVKDGAYREAIVKYLVKQGKADFAATDKEGRTPLHLAAIEEPALIKYFVCDCNMAVDVKDKNGKTPLDLAIEKNSFSGMRCLFYQGAKAGNDSEKVASENARNYFRFLKSQKVHFGFSFLSIVGAWAMGHMCLKQNTSKSVLLGLCGLTGLSFAAECLTSYVHHKDINNKAFVISEKITNVLGRIGPKVTAVIAGIGTGLMQRWCEELSKRPFICKY